MTNDDDDLRDEFARLRRVDARRPPAFDAMRARARTPKVRPLRPVVIAMFPLVAAAAVLVLLFGSVSQRDAAPSSAAAPSQAGAQVQDGADVLARSDDEPAQASLPLDFLLARASSTHREGSDFLLRTPTDLRGHTP